MSRLIAANYDLHRPSNDLPGIGSHPPPFRRLLRVVADVRSLPVHQPNPTPPSRTSWLSEVGDRWTLAGDGWHAEVDPSLGARITGFFAGNVNLLTGPDTNPNNFGSTFWTSPQTDWAWPPPPEVDHLPYTVVEGDEALVCCGMACPKLGLLVTKRFRVVASNQSLLVQYEICNQSPDPIRVAPWEISRVPGGLTLFMAGEPVAQKPEVPKLQLTEAANASWYAYSRAAVTTDQKMFAHRAEGWLAHFWNGFVLIKEFEPINAQKQAPGEAMIELFASGLSNYIEIEQQGAYAKIAPRKSVCWPVTWKVRKVPTTLEVQVGNPAVIAWVRSQLGQ